MRAARAPFLLTARVPLLLAAFLLAALILLPSVPAHALEKGVMEDMVVEQGETVPEIRTVMGDVRVEGEVEGDVSSAFGDVEVRGLVGGDVEAGFGDVLLYSRVGEDVEAGYGDVELGPDAEIGGDVFVKGGKLDNHGAAIAGNFQTGMTGEEGDEDSPLGVFSDVIGWGVMTLGLAAAAVLLAVAAPGPLRASARSLEGAPGRSLLLGLGSLPAMIVASILLLFTVVGGLLLPLLWPAYLALVVFGALVVVYFLGRKVVLATGRYRAGDALAAVVGALLVSAAYQIPFLGGLVFAGLAFLGTGAAVLALLTRTRTRRPTYASYEEYLQARRDA